MNTRLALELMAAAPQPSSAEALPGPARIWWMRTSGRMSTLWDLPHEGLRRRKAERRSRSEHAYPIA